MDTPERAASTLKVEAPDTLANAHEGITILFWTGKPAVGFRDLFLHSDPQSLDVGRVVFPRNSKHALQRLKNTLLLYDLQ